MRVEYLCKNYVIFLGGGGEVIKRLHWITGGKGGGLGSPKKDYAIFEWSLIYLPHSASHVEWSCRVYKVTITISNYWSRSGAAARMLLLTNYELR